MRLGVAWAGAIPPLRRRPTARLAAAAGTTPLRQRRILSPLKRLDGDGGTAPSMRRSAMTLNLNGESCAEFYFGRLAFRSRSSSCFICSTSSDRERRAFAAREPVRQKEEDERRDREDGAQSADQNRHEPEIEAVGRIGVRRLLRIVKHSNTFAWRELRRPCSHARHHRPRHSVRRRKLDTRALRHAMTVARRQHLDHDALGDRRALDEQCPRHREEAADRAERSARAR